jgi:hypothetical protein
MEIQETTLAPRLRAAGVLITLGLLVELLTLAWNNPIAFLVFLGIGGVLIAIGVVVYLISLVSPPGAKKERPSARV